MYLLVKELKGDTYYEGDKGLIVYVYDVYLSLGGDLGIRASILRKDKWTAPATAYGKPDQASNLILELTRIPAGIVLPPDLPAPPRSRCECGVSLVGGIHSDWCSAREDD